ncbi:hypothetical protein MACH05_20590 [Qipengyuania nanhaisediminis]
MANGIEGRSTFELESAASTEAADIPVDERVFLLALRAKEHMRQRTVREKSLPNKLLGEPAWDMLLELFCAKVSGTRLSIKSASIASGARDTTALRVIGQLMEAGLVERTQSSDDKRVKLLSLTPKGFVAVSQILETYA